MIGIDIVEVERIEKAMQENNFLQRVLTQSEIQYVSKFKGSTEHVAGFFAAKEAVMKALKDCKQISFLNIQICHEPNGSPYVILSGKAKQVFDASGYKNIEISISQTKNYGAATAILVK